MFHNYFFPFTQGFAYVDANDMNALENAVTDKTCAVMLELIQGEGGVNILDKDYVQSLLSSVTKRIFLLLLTRYRQVQAEQASCSLSRILK